MNIYENYSNLNPKDLKRTRDMFFAEFRVAETTLQNFLQGVTSPKNKYVKFFSILFDLKENLSPIVLSANLSREYRPFQYKEYKSEAKAKVDNIFSPKEKTTALVQPPKAIISYREQAH
jgi:hypothetical protein